MLNLILKIYRNYKNTNFKEIWKRIGQLPIHIIVLFTVLLISAILSFVAQAKLGNSKWCWILMAIELGSTIALGFTSEKHSLDNSKENMNDYINECQTMYKEVFQKYFKSKEQLNILLDRANIEIAKLQIKIDKKYDDLKKNKSDFNNSHYTCNNKSFVGFNIGYLYVDGNIAACNYVLFDCICIYNCCYNINKL